METHSNRLLVFSVVGLLLASLAVFVLWLLAAQNPDGRDYLIRFTDSVRGLKDGASVTYAGVPAGVVTDVRLDARDPSLILVTVRLDAAIPILDGAKAEIARSLLGDDATITIDGSRKGAAPITASTDRGLPVIPAKKGGLLGSGGDPMALIEKISRSVDNVSSNLDARGQQRARERLTALSAASSAWPDRAARLADSLTRSRGGILDAGASAARAGERADRIREELGARGPRAAGIGGTLLRAQGATEKFGRDVEGFRPAIRRIDGQARKLTDRIRSARSSTQRIGERAGRIDREGIQLFGSPALPKYGPARRSGAQPARSGGTDSAPDAGAK